MKKTIFLFIAILFGVSVFGQLGGDGLSPTSAYYGTIIDAQSWTSGTIYVGQPGNEDLTIGTGGSLSISSGVTVIFCTNSSDLIITGTGTITANGTSSSKITFTRNYPSINYWGHISFESMGSAGASSFYNCIIEYGDVSSYSTYDPHGGGGGIFIDFSNVSITDCIIQHNKSQWGGGIFVQQYRYPAISKCYFYDNSAKEAGGGIFLWDYSSSVIENSIFYSNSCQGTSGYSGGGLAALSSCNIQVVNCTFTNNTSSLTDGQGLLLSSSSGSKVVNSIFWGSSNQISLATSSQIINCAIQGYTSGYTNCITLSGTNTDPSGPNFYNVTAGSEDFQITFNSPCRDAGTAAGAPSTDILGKFRVGLPDIGAYEVQYSNWTGGAHDNTWATPSNWEASINPASGSGDVVIPFISGSPANYPIATFPPDFTIATGKTMILRPGAEVTLGALINNGTLRLESDLTGISSLIFNSYSGNYANIQLYLPGGGSSGYWAWHYISPPVVFIPATFFSTAGAAVATYEESLISNDMNNGWVTSSGYHYNPTTGVWETATPPIWINLLPGSGYNYYASSDKTFTISGSLNTADTPITLKYNSIFPALGTPDAANQGWNLIGNPFTCGLDWEGVISANPSIWSNVEATIYFRVDGVMYYYIGGLTVPDTYNSDGSMIPPMQGFFIHSNENNVALYIPVSAKTHTANKRYKGNSSPPHIRLQFENAVKSDQMIVSFNEKATLSYDNLFDARKIFTSDSDPYIYSVLNGIKYSINGIPFPVDSITIPLVVNASTDGSYTIKATELVGLDTYKVFLNDKSQNLTINLADDSSYKFNATTGTSLDRFTLTITNVLTAVPENTISVKPFNIYSSNGAVNIQTLDDTWNGRSGGIRVFDMTGRVLTTQDNIEFSKDALIQIPVRVATGIYMVEIRSGVMRYVGKVIIR